MQEYKAKDHLEDPWQQEVINPWILVRVKIYSVLGGRFCLSYECVFLSLNLQQMQRSDSRELC